MFKIGQKVRSKHEAFYLEGGNGIVVSRAPKFGKGWYGVMWTLPNGRREQRVEHWSVIEGAKK